MHAGAELHRSPLIPASRGPSAMSYPQLGYPYSSAPQFLMPTNSLTSCCESRARSVSESGSCAPAPPPPPPPPPPPQAPVYCPVYESRLLATARHELGVYSNPYASGQGYGNYVTYGTEASAFYSLGAFDAKDSAASASITQAAAAAYYPYDPTLGQYQYDRYGSMDGGTRRKNATRETTSTLKAWLQEHRKNPYPTKGEKIMLAIITKMTLTQVSTWFANARRRLKKENKMTWAPRNKGSDEKRCGDDDDASQEEQIKSDANDDESRSRDDKELQLSDLDDFDAIESESSECDMKHQFHVNAHMNTLPEHLKETSLKLPSLEGDALKLPPIRTTLERDADLPKSCLKTASRDCEHNPNGNTKICFQQDHQTLDSKPRIWSLAQTATSLNPTNEYSSCMLRCQPAIPGSSSPPVKVAEKQQDSPVTTLRHWMDGVFHDPLFKHSTLDQAHNSNTAVSWSTTKGSILESGAQRD